jgi:hypothetical protein
MPNYIDVCPPRSDGHEARTPRNATGSTASRLFSCVVPAPCLTCTSSTANSVSSRRFARQRARPFPDPIVERPGPQFPRFARWVVACARTARADRVGDGRVGGDAAVLGGPRSGDHAVCTARDRDERQRTPPVLPKTLLAHGYSRAKPREAEHNQHTSAQQANPPHHLAGIAPHTSRELNGGSGCVALLDGGCCSLRCAAPTVALRARRCADFRLSIAVL